MVTDEERRDVARRLRKLSHGYVTVGDYREAIGIDDRPNLEYDEVTGEPVLRKIDLDDTSAEMLRLADLIEPEPERTCHNVSNDEKWFTCSECGANVYGGSYRHSSVDESGVRWYTTANKPGWNYCPDCGAKVVDE